MINEQIFRIRKNGKPYSSCFCRTPELIENYAKANDDTSQTWECHHRLESCFTRKFLIDMGLYYDQPPEAFIFLTLPEHMSLHYKGKKIPSETKRKMSSAAKNRKNNYYCGNAGRGKTWKVINGKRVWLDRRDR